VPILLLLLLLFTKNLSDILRTMTLDPQDALHTVFQASVVDKLSYSSSAWWGLTCLMFIVSNRLYIALLTSESSLDKNLSSTDVIPMVEWKKTPLFTRMFIQANLILSTCVRSKSHYKRSIDRWVVGGYVFRIFYSKTVNGCMMIEGDQWILKSATEAKKRRQIGIFLQGDGEQNNCG